MREELKLELSEEKTLITHARSGAARFLGYEITVRQANRKRTKNRASGTKRRSINGHIGLRVPRTVLVDKCNRYKKRNKVMPRTELLNESDYTIISTYQLEFQGIANYYQLAYNMHTLHYLRWVMDQSLTKTLARKHHTSVQHICDQYKAELLVDGVIYKGLRVIVPRDGKTPLVAYVAESLVARGEHVCILTRGYGRENAKKRVLVSDGEKILATASESGDEPFELAKKLSGNAIIIAEADRSAAGEWAKSRFDVTTFILDDGFQHRQVSRVVDLAVVSADRWSRSPRLLPAGPFREPLASVRGKTHVLHGGDVRIFQREID